MQQHGLRLVIAVMTDGNFHGSALFGRFSEEPVAFLSADLLKRSSLAIMQPMNIYLLTDASDAHARAETANKCFIPVRFLFARAMIEVRDRQMQPEFVRQTHENSKKSHRVWTAGNRHDEMISSLQHGVGINRSPDLIQHIG
jgi:hypothetical protein